MRTDLWSVVLEFESILVVLFKFHDLRFVILNYSCVEEFIETDK